jgi:alpha-mannosidase
LPLQIIERGGYSPVDPRERVVAGFVAHDMPGFGYKTYRAEYGVGDQAIKLSSNQRASIENEYFRVEANAADGTFTVLDKPSGDTLAGLNRFVDSGERGDEYTYCPPKQDLFVDRPTAPPVIAVVEDGPVRSTLEVRMAYALPARLTKDRSGRADELVDCEIVTRASLYPGVARIDIETEVDNRAEDHRLRVHFPSGVRAERSAAEQHFGVVERPIGVPEHDNTWMETPVATYPQKTFVDVSDGARGLMLANRGLPEYEALPEEDGTITVALTLLRCVAWLSRQDMNTRRGHAGPPMYTPGAQMAGHWRFQYALIPHAGGWENAWAEAHRFARPLRAVRVTRGTGSLPAEGSLVTLVPGTAVLSALKPAEDDDSTVLRLYNIAPGPVDASVDLHAPHSAVERVDLNEENAQPIAANDGARLSLRTNEIVTLKFRT